MKKTNNKGFSLVELIVVVAIMAVLMVVLAPQYLRYVERTRLQKDNSTIAEIANACKLAMADSYIASKTPSGTIVTLKATDDKTNVKVEFVSGVTAATGGDATALAKELEGVFGAEFETESNTYKESKTDIVLKIIVEPNGSAKVDVVGFIEAVDATASTGDTNGNGTQDKGEIIKQF